MAVKKIVWSMSARVQLKEVYNYIRKDSLANAEKVRKRVIAVSKSLPLHPEKYPLDKYKLNNTGNYRTFILYKYRISYKIEATSITILRIRHTAMEPLEY